jgi:hypothetical protein
MKKCSVEGCDRPHNSRGLCAMHVGRLRRNGDPLINKNWKGGVSKHPLYGAWSGMIGRCHNPNHYSYHQYGARGIVVTQRWREFENFLKDMGERPEGHTLDRVDPNGPYAPWNCRWATPSEQRRNISKEGENANAQAHEPAR